MERIIVQLEVLKELYGNLISRLDGTLDVYNMGYVDALKRVLEDFEIIVGEKNGNKNN